jgi:tol-pal system protein YbgF
MIRWNMLAPAACVAAGACVASKGDIRLLQDELRASRTVIARGDTAASHADDARRRQIDALSSDVRRTNDSLRALSTRMLAFQARTDGELDELAKQLIQLQALAGQTTRNIQDIRAAWESAQREQAIVPSATSPDTGARSAPAVPPPTALFQDAKKQLDNGSYRTARMGFEQLLASYPNADQAPRALFYVAGAYDGERNQAAADSVYQLVVGRYPKSPEAASALYKRAQILSAAGKNKEAVQLLQQLIREYPSADASDLAKDLLRTIQRP